MNCLKFLGGALLLSFFCNSQGTTCSNATNLTLDGIYRNYTLSTATGSSILCTSTGYSGNNGRVTYFKFTTDASAQCMTIDIATTSVATLEIVLYESCTDGNAAPLGGYSVHSMCMPSGSGIWAPDLFNSLLPNTTYYLRVRTANNYTGDLIIGGKYVTPPNDNCIGATSISGVAVTDNNACHTSGPSVTAANLCATTLENTAWYTYTLLNSGSTTITINNIECNNGDGNSNNGFQIGFFKGTCNSLIPVSCSNGAGGMVQSTATGLTAGDKIFVAIDGYSGSNCRYTISASNAQALAVRFKKFSAERKSVSNKLTWISIEDADHRYYDVERSEDGIRFSTIKHIPSIQNFGTEQTYSFEDISPPKKCWYRLKNTDMNGRHTYSYVLEVDREAALTFNVQILQSPQNRISIKVLNDRSEKANIRIVAFNGQIIFSSELRLLKGVTYYNASLPSIPKGKYMAVIETGQDRKAIPFIK